MDDFDTPDEWRELQKRWRNILFDMPQATCVQFIRDTVSKTECPFVTFSVCDLLRYRFDGPDCALEALDELRKLQGHPNALEQIDAWGARTRAALRRVMVSDPGLQPIN
jgi:hypothetical protein